MKNYRYSYIYGHYRVKVNKQSSKVICDLIEHSAARNEAIAYIDEGSEKRKVNKPGTIVGDGVCSFSINAYIDRALHITSRGDLVRI